MYTRTCSVTVGLLMIALAGCGAPFRDHLAGPVDGTLVVQTLAEPQPAPQPYRIQRGDNLAIRFYRNPELDNEVVVRPDGMISLPLIDDVAAAGSSPQQLGEDLEHRYKGELAVPDVTVIVKTFGAQRIYVGGSVDKPGELELVAGLTVFGAIQKAGGFKDAARESQVILIRTGADRKPKGTSLDLTAVRAGTHPEQDVALEPYDIVYVPKSSIGNVNTFVELYVTRNIPGGIYWLGVFF